jgi:pimeloyl-ACP methyl ester carboxylesterase
MAAEYEVVAGSPRDAPWIAMVHGMSQDRRMFARQVDAFRHAYRLLLIDLPGHGLSSHQPGPYDLGALAASVGGALAHAGIGPCHFWATHTGAGAGLLLACETPALFRSLVLEGAVLPGHPLPSAAELLERLNAVVREQGLDAAREIWWQEGRWFDVMRERPVECRAAEQRAIIDDFQGGPWLETGLTAQSVAAVDEALSRLPIPALLVNGEHELPDFLAAAAGLQALLPRCERAFIADAGGFPLWEFPDRVNPVVARFLASV